MNVHQVQLKDLNNDYIQHLHQQYSDKNLHVEIRVQANHVSDSRPPEMNETAFWKTIDRLDWSKEGNDEAVIAPVIEYLMGLSEASILTFYDLLSEKLYLLDGEEFAKHSTKSENGPSSDLFLYARCCVVANGQQFFKTVLQQPNLFPKDIFFERLLDIPQRAWFRKTGKWLEHRPRFIFETGFNPHGWGEKTITL